MKKTVLAIALVILTVLSMAACTTSVPTAAPSAAASEAASAAPTTAEATATPAAPLNGGKLVLGFDENFPPMGFKQADGTFAGFDIDVATEVCKRLGLELKLQPIDWDSKNLELDNKNIDVIWNGFSVTDEQKEKVLFSNPYMKNRQVLVVNKDSSYKTMADLNGKNIGIQSGSSAETALNAAADFKKSVKVVSLGDNMTALMDLQNGGLDAVLMDEIVANYNITQKGAAYRVLDESLAGEDYAIGFRKADSALCDAVNATLKAMAQDGTLAQISTKWFGKDITTIVK